MERIRPADKFRQIVAVIRFCARLMGVDVLNESFKPGFITAIVVFSIIDYLILAFWSIVVFFPNDWTILLEVFAGISCSVQGLTKLVSTCHYKNIVFSIYRDILSIYEKYQYINRRYERKLFEWNERMKKIFLVIGAFYFVLPAVMLMIPPAMYLYNGELYQVALASIPGIDKETGYGYAITNSFDCFCVLLLAFGLYGADLVLIMYLTFAIFFYDIFEIKVDELRELVAKNEKNDQQRIPELVNDLVEWHQFYLNFNKKCNQVFYWSITVHMACTTLSIISTILIILLKDWPGAYAYLVLSFVWIYTYSIIGTRVEICNDQFCDGIYAINWYDLPVPQQKIVKLMLLKSQVPQNIFFGGVVPLNVKTALTITRTIYSMTMLVLQFWG